MIEGHVTHAEQRGIHVLRYFGTVNFMLAPGIQRFVDDLIEHGSISGLVFDLSQANSLDSTNLGLMARVNERLLGVGAANSVIISGDGDIDVVLRSMGFDQTFDVLTTTPTTELAPAEPIRTESPSATELRETMLAAHQALVRMSDAGRLEFEPVVACLERSS
ncbi:MAG TPA: STAS domain-containing protein [Polyangiaceae bacterium]|jgi:anti-anti-sigma factor|nr:STAS domain-containing protein [Polyangiaceae bacterium]